jgi:molybdenum cofactor cytidylyltransferase
MGRPKALLRLGDRSFLQTILDTAAQVGLHRIVVVGESTYPVLEHHLLADVQVVVNRNLDVGPIGSIRAAIREVDRTVSGLLVWPVDIPAVGADAIRAIVNEFERSNSPIVTPRYTGRRGHPVLFARSVFDELDKVAEGQGARAVVRRDPQRVAVVDVDDPGVVEDVNTPEHFERLVRRWNG